MFLVGIVTCILNFYGVICILGIISGKKLNYYCTLTAPILYCWILYGGGIGAWTIINVILLPHIHYGYWIYVGAASASLVLRYHLKMYYNELKKIKAFILLMS